jgi:Mg-chelatase subunit ChlD
MKSKIIFVFIFSKLIVLQLFAQSNSCIQILNKANEESLEITHCLYNTAKTLWQVNQANRTSMVSPECLHEKNPSEAFIGFEKNIPSGTIHFKNMNDAKNLYTNYHQKATELYTYIASEEYKKDKGELGLQKLKEIAVIFNKIREIVEYYAKEASEKRLVVPNNTNKFAKYHLNFAKIGELQRNFIISHTFLNMNFEVNTYYPYFPISQNVLKMNELYGELPKEIHGMEYKISSNYDLLYNATHNCIYYTLNHPFYAKRKVMKGEVAGANLNELYMDVLQYFNGQYVKYYNQYIKAFSINAPLMVAVSPYLYYPENKEYSLLNVDYQEFKEITFSPITPQKQNSIISKDVNNVLNAYVEYINQSVSALNHFMYSIDGFQDNVNRASEFLLMNPMESYKRDTHIKLELGVFYYEYFEAYNNSNILGSQHANSLNIQMRNLKSIYEEIYFLKDELVIHSFDKMNFLQKLSRCQAITDRIDKLYLEFGKRQNNLYYDLKKIFESYAFQASNPWRKSWNTLILPLELTKEEFLKEQRYFKENEEIIVGNKTIDSLVSVAFSQEFSNMSGIPKSEDFVNPYRAYEETLKAAKEFKADTVHFKKYSSYNHYYATCSYYNNSVTKFNEFVGFSTIPLLKRNYQVNYFLREKAKSKDILLKEKEEKLKREKEWEKINNQPKKDTELITNTNIKKNTSDIKVIHDTVRIIDVLRIETRRVDTVYVKESKSDTVYLSNEGENFLSLKGCASNNMVFLLDVSGSMQSPEKLPLLKKSIKLLIRIMRPEDFVSIVIYAGKGSLLLAPTSAKELNKIEKAIEKLQSKGQTNVIDGLKLALKTADKSYIRNGNNKIILATDGEFVINNELESIVDEYATKDISLSIFDFGKDKVKENLNKIAQKGKGTYLQINKENCDVALIKEAKKKLK